MKRKIIKITHLNQLIFYSLALFLTACSTIKPGISVSHHKAWNDDQIFEVLAAQHKQMNALNDGISAKDLQEAFSVKQATQTNSSISVSPTAGGLVSAPTAPESSKISLEKLSAPSDDVGLTHSALLRSKVGREWDLLGRKLLYSGDMQVADNNNKLILVRFDISVNNYIEMDDKKKFAYVKFTVNAIQPGKKVIVYFLSPEYKSVVSKESLITSRLEDYAGQAGGTFEGVDIQGAVRHQRALEEGLLRLIETPTEFGIYGDSPNEYLFALGPRRVLVKRSWMNPMRIFGDKYRIDYELEPGSRAVYALLLVDKNEQKIVVEIEKYGKGVVNSGDSLDSSSFNPLANNIIINVSSPVYPLVPGVKDFDIYPALLNVIPIQVPNKISANTEVFIGHTAVAKENVSIMGRNLLKITLPPNKELSSLLKLKSKLKPNPAHTLEVYAVTPGQNTKQHIANFKLKDSVPAKVPAPHALAPEEARAGEDIKLTIPGVDLSTIQCLKVGNKTVIPIPSTKDKTSLFFTIPDDVSKKKLKVSLKLYTSTCAHRPEKLFKYIPSAFTHIVE